MSESIMTLSYEENAQGVSTKNINICDTNDTTDITTNEMLMRQPSEIKNNKGTDNVIETQDVAENLAVNSNNVNKHNPEVTVENKKTESGSTSSENVEIQTRNVIYHLQRKSCYFKRSRQNTLAQALIKRSIRCLNKMHVMEDVHEGCNAQPSSPGHADQRQDIMEMCNENAKENDDLQSENDNDLKITDIKTENDDESKIVVKMENTENNSSLNEGSPNVDNETGQGNDDSISSDSIGENNGLKRKLDNESCIDSPSKKLHTQIQKSFLVRDEILNKYMESIGCSTIEQIQVNTEQIMCEIRKLNEIAKQKEKEWNNILYLKKMKEELLIRLQRQKQLILLNNDDFEPDYAFTNSEDRYQNANNDNIQRIKSNNVNAETKNANYLQDKHILSRQKSFNGKNMIYNQYDMNGQNDYRQNKNRPTLDVKSLIADYRQKHPETVPRRGRRIRTALSQCETKISAGGVLNLSNVALGSGAQVRQNPNNGGDLSKEMGFLMNNNEEIRKDNILNADSSAHTDSTSFKDMLAQFAKLSQAERQEILHNAVKPPPPYPEVTVHPVPTTSTSTSLLHGILTKNQTKPDSKSTFSPTLARLLTAPEKTSQQTTANHGNTVASITDILCNNKTRNEITITPVGQYDTPAKGKANQMEEDETEDSVDRLVIDESGEVVDARTKDNNSDLGEEVPQCQGCNQKPAQFVCAGCANQWYCSRDCQVSAWDEHSEVCSG